MAVALAPYVAVAQTAVATQQSDTALDRPSANMPAIDAAMKTFVDEGKAASADPKNGTLS